MTDRYYASTALPTTLTLNITPVSTVIDVAALVGYPSSFPYTLCIDFDTGLRELVEVTNAAGTTLTVTRAIDGTSAVAHSAGATVRHVSSARDYADSRAHENASTNVHGLAIGSAVVGTNDTQTLSNKTLNSPMFTGTVNLASPTITGTVGGSATYTTPTLTNPTVSGGTFNEVTVTNDAVGDVPLTVNTVAAQTADLQRWRINGVDTFKILGTGGVVMDPPGNPANMIEVNATSGFSGDWLDFKKNAVIKFQVDNDGAITTVNGITNAGAIMTTAAAPTDIPLNVNAHASQSDDIVQVFNPTGVKSVWVDEDGTFQVQGSATGLPLVARLNSGAASNDVAAVTVRDKTNTTKLEIRGNGQISSVASEDRFMLVLDRPATVASDSLIYRKGGVPLAGITDSGDLYATNFTSGAWNSWTPVFSATGGGFSLGNGTVGGRYAIIGNTIAVEGFFKFGSTTNMGIGTIRCTLPFSPDISATDHQFIISAMCFDVNGGLPYSASGIIRDPSIFEFASFKAGVAGFVSGSASFPFTWAANIGATIRFSGVYQSTV